MKAILALTLFLAASGLSSAQDAEAIMDSVRQVAVLQKAQDLHGTIQKEGGKKTPLKMSLRGKDIRFDLNGGKEVFLLRLNQGNQELNQLIGGKLSKFPRNKIAAPIADSDVSYEDLALSFLYWPKPFVAGKQEVINGQDCWRLHVANPGKSGRYREVSLWVTKKQRALLRVVGYGPKPEKKPLKQFGIEEVMNINGRWTVKRMKVNVFNADGRTTDITHIRFRKPLEVKPRGRGR